MSEPQLFSQLSDDEKTRIHLKAALKLMRDKKAALAARLEETRTGTLRDPNIARDYEDLLTQYSHVTQNIGFVESVLIYL